MVGRLKVKVAAVQMASIIGEVEQNRKKAESLVSEAINQGAKIICLPEMFNTGYFSHTSHCDPAYFDLGESIEGITINGFRQLARKHKVFINVPFFELDSPGTYYNSSCLVDDEGNIAGLYRKTHVAWSMTGWEKFYMRQGYHYPVFQTPYGKIGIMICYDRDFPEVARTLGLQGADLILVPNGSSMQLTEIWKNIIQVRAYENQLYILGACLTGRVDEEHHHFTGHSILANPYGEIKGILGREEGILLEEIDLYEIHNARKKRFLYRDRRPEIYGKLVEY